jgi:hypothetical protein
MPEQSTPGDHELWLASGSQTWQGFAGFTAPSAKHSPLMKHDVAVTVHCVCDRLGLQTRHASSALASPVARQTLAIEQQVPPQQIA